MNAFRVCYEFENQLLFLFTHNILAMQQREQGEVDLRVSEEILRATFALIGDAVITTGETSRVTSLNPMAERLTGWTQGEALGRPISEVFCLISARTTCVANKSAEQSITTGVLMGLNGQALLIARDGTQRQIANNTAPITDAQGRIIGAVLVFRDLTQEYVLQEQMRQIQKMNAIGQLAGGVAHDLNNMITGIVGGAEWLRKELNSANDGVVRHLNMIQTAAERATGLTRKMLSVARNQPTEMMSMDSHTAIIDAIALLSSAFDRRMAVKTEFHAEDATILGDYVQLENVILNLGINAGHAMPNGGTLTIRTCNVLLDACGRNRAGIASDIDRFLDITVSDTGCGIPPENMSRIFEPFFTTKPGGQGTGLGLSTAFDTIKKHGGALSVTSIVGHGSRFRILLPLCRTQPGHMPPQHRPSTPV